MTAAALALVALSCVSHVYWNFRIKRSPNPVVYTWWLQVFAAVQLLPAALWLAWPLSVPRAGWYCVLGTGAIYAVYFTLIARSYDREDISRAYPIARGIAPVASAVWGVLFYHEHPSPGGWLGIAAVSLGVFLLAGCETSNASRLPMTGILAAIGTGLCTSAYSAVDKAGVQYVHPSLYIVLTFLAGAAVQGVVLLPRQGWPAVRAEARRAWPDMAGSAILSAGGYLLILYVLRFAPVSYVVPIRSFGVLLSVAVGARMLGEKITVPRLFSALLIVSGICAIALAG